MIDLFYLGLLAVMAYRGYKHRNNNRNFALILMFVVHCALQPYIPYIGNLFGEKAPYFVGVSIILISTGFALYAYFARVNKYWSYLALVASIGAVINAAMLILYHFFAIKRISYYEYLFYDDIATQVIIVLTMLEAYFIIRATNGRGESRRYRRDAWLGYFADVGRLELLSRDQSFDKKAEIWPKKYR